jgi:hypothetical protein
VVGFNFRISNLVDPLTAMISCPFVPENDPTAAKEILVGGERVRLSKCILTGCRRARLTYLPKDFRDGYPSCSASRTGEGSNERWGRQSRRIERLEEVCIVRLTQS